MAPERPVYILGIKAKIPPHVQAKYGTWDDIRNLILADLAHAERNGFPCTLQVLDSENLDQGLAEFEAALEAGKDKYAGLQFGAGIRGHADPVPFERAINIAFKVLGPNMPIMFNDGPDRHCWAIERCFGVKMEVD